MTDYNDGNWYGWNGGECPVHPKSHIHAVFWPLRRESGPAGNWCWADEETPIIAFRVVKPYREPREFWLNVYPNDFVFAYATKEEAESCKISARLACIRVREVLDE